MSADIAGELSRQTRELISRFETRADSFRNRGDLAALTVQVDESEAEDSARLLFGVGEHVATGIDGSMDFDERLQMMLFYANSTAYSCHFTVGDHIRFDLEGARRESRLAATAAVPLWAEDLGSVFNGEPEVDIELEHSMERIPNCFMTLGEMYLAVRACEKAKVVFLDRPLSGTFSTLSRDTRNLIKRGESRLTKWGGGSHPSMVDIFLALNLGAPSMAVPTRSLYLPAAVIKALLPGRKTFAKIAAELAVEESRVRSAVRKVRARERRSGWSILERGEEEGVELASGVSGYWERVSQLSSEYSRAVFAAEVHPLALNSEEYLTILDVNTLALIQLELLCEKARQRGVLLIGIAKDTTATDISRSVLPFALSEGAVRPGSPPPRLKNDRAFLSILSSENPSIRTPWRTLSYDSSFSTVVHIGGRFRSARKVVSREKLFARSFFQLRTSKHDQAVRSQVFLFDRLYDYDSDSGSTRKLQVEENAGPTEVDAYFEGDGLSRRSNLILHILSMNDNPEVFEAFGYNQLLFLADKAVKAEVRLLRSSLRGIADLRVGGVSRRRRIFGLVTTYREQRADAEHSRSRTN
ncbi:MAG: hypothetical protein HY296_02230 [Thaumarchaeota archaeon]|nr:hypothetical protein [Nitrososphaerota archaeon]